MDIKFSYIFRFQDIYLHHPFYNGETYFIRKVSQMRSQNSTEIRENTINQFYHKETSVEKYLKDALLHSLCYFKNATVHKIQIYFFSYMQQFSSKPTHKNGTKSCQNVQDKFSCDNNIQFFFWRRYKKGLYERPDI